MKFVYVAVSLCAILNDFSLINKEAVVEYIMKCQTYEGGFGQAPNLEAHGMMRIANLKIIKENNKIKQGGQKLKAVHYCL